MDQAREGSQIDGNSPEGSRHLSRRISGYGLLEESNSPHAVGHMSQCTCNEVQSGPPRKPTLDESLSIFLKNSEECIGRRAGKEALPSG